MVKHRTLFLGSPLQIAIPKASDAVSYAPRNAIFTGIDVTTVVAVGAM